MGRHGDGSKEGWLQTQDDVALFQRNAEVEDIMSHPTTPSGGTTGSYQFPLEQSDDSGAKG